MVALAGVPPEHAGAASGMWSTVQQFAGASGVAVLGSAFFASLDGGHQAAFTVVSVVAATVFAVCAVLGLALEPRRRAGEG